MVASSAPTSPQTAATPNQTGVCVKCRTKVPMLNPIRKQNKRRVQMLQSFCGTCNSRVNTFVKNTPPVAGSEPDAKPVPELLLTRSESQIV